VSQQLGVRHKTIGMRAHQVVSVLRRWLPGVTIKLLGDGRSGRLHPGTGAPLHRKQITLMADGPLVYCERDAKDDRARSVWQVTV
jgi:hypothetical protein